MSGCGKWYHQTCLTSSPLWPQVRVGAALACPHNPCHTCASGNIRDPVMKYTEKLIHCVRCSTAHHCGDYYVAAGTTTWLLELSRSPRRTSSAQSITTSKEQERFHECPRERQLVFCLLYVVRTNKRGLIKAEQLFKVLKGCKEVREKENSSKVLSSLSF